MSKFVLGAFKTIFISMLIVFVFDMTAYIIKVRTLNQRMLNTMNNMQKTVQTENGMSESMYKMYNTIFNQYKDQMKDTHTGLGDFIITGGSDAVRLNYNRTADSSDFTENGYFNNANDGVNRLVSAYNSSFAGGSGSSRSALITDMSQYGGLGDMMIIRAQVVVQSPLWAFTGGDGGGDASATSSSTNATYGKGTSAVKWNRVKGSKIQLNYMYVVPCMHYQKVSD